VRVLLESPGWEQRLLKFLEQYSMGKILGMRMRRMDGQSSVDQRASVHARKRDSMLETRFKEKNVA